MSPINNQKIPAVLYKLALHFLSGSLKFDLGLDEIEDLTPEVQKAFLNSTIYLPSVNKYPLNNHFCRIFFKKIISYLENVQDIHDEMYSFLCSEMEKPTEDDEFGYRHFILKNDINNIITIKETKKMVVHGTTGMKTWEAAFMLTDWALCNEELLKNKRLLELGSGVGFTGIAITKHCDIQSMTLTDCHEEVLSTLKNNVRINLPQFQEEEMSDAVKFSDKQKTLGVTMLDWNYVEDIPDDELPDILMGADIVYDPSILPALCNVLQIFFRRNNNLDVYIASVIRNKDTYKQFLDALEKLSFKHEEIQLLPACVVWDEKIERKFIKIKL